MAKRNIPSTPAIHALRKHDVNFTAHPYPYEDHGGTACAAQGLDIDEHIIIKTLLMESSPHNEFIVLMHGDREVSTKALARQLKEKHIQPCSPATAQRLTGYQVGGISPLGTRTSLPVYVESTILDLEKIYINGGRRGLMVCLNPRDLARIFSLTPVEVAITP